jgi:choline dehydrogenase-like flavoprotein
MDPMTSFDAVIVGAGISGALTAWKLARNGYKVLILEAGPSLQTRQFYINNYYANQDKFPEAPYPGNLAAPSPDVATLAYRRWKYPLESYFVYTPDSRPYGSTYERLAGGTVWHWLGSSLRFNPSDFKLYTNYLSKSAISDDPGIDWPIGYEDLEPWYEQAEHVIGVAANVEDQRYPAGAPFRAGYKYPMPGIKQSYVDKVLGNFLNGLSISDQDFEPPVNLTVRSTPQARNSIPRDGRPPCMGNTSCVPICPIAAKYDPSFHLKKAVAAGAVLQTQSVACNILVNDQSSAKPKITGIEYKRWDGTTETAVGKVYFVAANAVETPKLLLMSNKQIQGGIANSSGLVGNFLMDHNTQLSWALMPPGQNVYPYRGPLSTSGIEEVRDGLFRAKRGAFRIEIGNEGWNWPTGSPYSTVRFFSMEKGLFGKQLRSALADDCKRHIRFASLVEPMPYAGNKVRITYEYKDHLDLPRPLISYSLQPYERAGLQAARNTALAIFKKLGAIDSLQLLGVNMSANQQNVDYVKTSATPEGFFGAGHTMGTNRMGIDPKTSVVDNYMRCHDHPNLFLIGGGVFPSVGTSNPTLTLAALSLRTAAHVMKTLGDPS